MFKYRARRKDNSQFAYGDYFEENHLGIIKGAICFYDRLEGCVNYVEVDENSVSVYFGREDRNGKEIYTNDRVRYGSKEYEVKYFAEYGTFGLFDEKNNRPLGRSGSSTKYEPYFMNDYHCKRMEVVNK